jgi:uncharacterized protein with ACT and thioredoxin-like domain
VVTTVIAFLVLVFLDDLERKLIAFSTARIRAEVSDQPGTLTAFTQIFTDHGISIKRISMELDGENKKAHIYLQIRGHNINREKIMEEISLLPGIFSVKWN